MRTPLIILLALLLLAATPAMAGNLTFDNGQTTWHSTQCTKPTPPASVYGANPETSGEDMNDLISQHNAYVDLAQAYMDCISQESERDQSMVDQAIAASAQQEISATQGYVDTDARAIKKH